MLVASIPREVAAQAAMLNWFAGTLQAWAYLASQSIPEAQIFAYLSSLEGRELPHSGSIRNSKP